MLKGLFKTIALTRACGVRGVFSTGQARHNAVKDLEPAFLRQDWKRLALRTFATAAAETHQPRAGKKAVTRYFPARDVPIYNTGMERVGTYTLPGEVFSVPVRVDIMHRVVRWQRAKAQQGTHKTKTRGEVRGGGRKPWRQKGTGRARAGSIRAPQWKGGGTTFGPVVRSHEHDLPRKVRRLGMKCALSAKLQEDRLLLLDTLRPAEIKTKWMDEALDRILEGAPRRSVVLVDGGKESEDGGEPLRRVCNNLPWVDVLAAEGLNVYSILQRDYLAMTVPAIQQVVERLTRPIKR